MLFFQLESAWLRTEVPHILIFCSEEDEGMEMDFNGDSSFNPNAQYVYIGYKCILGLFYVGMFVNMHVCMTPGV